MTRPTPVAPASESRNATVRGSREWPPLVVSYPARLNLAEVEQRANSGRGTTAATHVSRLYAKLGVASRAEAIALALRHGWA